MDGGKREEPPGGHVKEGGGGKSCEEGLFIHSFKDGERAGVKKKGREGIRFMTFNYVANRGFCTCPIFQKFRKGLKS